MSSIAESLSRSESVLAQSGVVEPGREAVSLVMLATSRDRTFIYAHPEYELATGEAARLDSLLERRAAREPLQYISGVQEFFRLEFEVNPDVLIPRPETEMVVEHAIEFLNRLEAPRFCEIGVGSGCISVSILFNLTECEALGTDVSNAALQTAARNATKHKVADRLRLTASDVFDALPPETFDMIVSNPPYIPLTDVDALQDEVRRFEPHIALTDGGDGLSIVRRIVAGAPAFLRPGGALLMEIGFDQSSQVRELFDADKWSPAVLFPDLQGIPRVVFAERL
jgi:release factor glutamine methyltransferase